MDMELAGRMLDVVAAIPPGRVATYGDVAAAAGSPSPRLAGRVLAELSDDDTPWYRVLRANGSFAPQVAGRQAELLRAEGVSVTDGRVRLKDYRHSFSSDSTIEHGAAPHAVAMIGRTAQVPQDDPAR
ncbi:MAG: MGMT family protein [Actinomycetota bacterium]|nr:MGMT family protein [Actinomycetota bacterium]